MGSNDFNSLISDIFNEWNLTPIHNDVVDFMSDKGIVIDIYPFKITDLEKNHQVEVFYRKFLDRDIPKKTYLTCENKFLTFIKFLWIYNSTNVFYDLVFDNYFLKAIKKSFFFKQKHKSKIIHSISNWEELQTLSILALREAGYMFIHFKDWNAIAMINDFAMLILCRDAETNEKICNLANHCGLFVH